MGISRPVAKTKPKDPSQLDRRIGVRVRERRTSAGLSQSELGGKLGVSLQQIQKYEIGLNRISASRLLQISKLFRVPITFFYYGNREGRIPSAQPAEPAQLSDEVLHLVESFSLVRSAETREAIIALVDGLADGLPRVKDRKRLRR